MLCHIDVFGKIVVYVCVILGVFGFLFCVLNVVVCFECCCFWFSIVCF